MLLLLILLYIIAKSYSLAFKFLKTFSKFIAINNLI